MLDPLPFASLRAKELSWKKMVPLTPRRPPPSPPHMAAWLLRTFVAFMSSRVASALLYKAPPRGATFPLRSQPWNRTLPPADSGGSSAQTVNPWPETLESLLNLNSSPAAMLTALSSVVPQYLVSPISM